MKRYLLFFSGLGLLAFLGSCGDDPLPAATASFSFKSDTDNAPEVGRDITFLNESTNFATVRWDFGDGQVSDSISPTIFYLESGEYIVTLTAITADGQETVTSEDLIVGERIMVDFSISGISFTNSTGGTWDPLDSADSSAIFPDLWVVFGPEDDPNFERTIVLSPATPGADFLTNLRPDDLPFGFELNTAADPLILTPDERWDAIFFDDDGEEDFNNDGQPDGLQIMGGINFNPVFDPNTTFTTNGEGFLDLNLGGYSVQVGFRIDIP